MIKENITEKMDNCHFVGTPSCPYRNEMKSQYPAQEKSKGSQIEFTNWTDIVAQMDKDAEHCIECEKYEV